MGLTGLISDSTKYSDFVEHSDAHPYSSTNKAAIVKLPYALSDAPANKTASVKPPDTPTDSSTPLSTPIPALEPTPIPSPLPTPEPSRPKSEGVPTGMVRAEMCEL